MLELQLDGLPGIGHASRVKFVSGLSTSAEGWLVG